jgi:hypothetical protein
MRTFSFCTTLTVCKTFLAVGREGKEKGEEYLSSRSWSDFKDRIHIILVDQSGHAVMFNLYCLMFGALTCVRVRLRSFRCASTDNITGEIPEGREERGRWNQIKILGCSGHGKSKRSTGKLYVLPGTSDAVFMLAKCSTSRTRI